LLSVCVTVCIPPPINFWIPEPIFMKLGVYIMARELNGVLHKSLPSVYVSVCVYPYPC
jgi:hypothetical protein